MPKGKACSILWSARAKRDLDQIASYIARDNPQAARKWISKLRAARMPLAARVVPEIQRDDVREVFLRSYRIVYGVRDDHIFVFTVFGGGKLLSEDAVPEDYLFSARLADDDSRKQPEVSMNLRLPPTAGEASPGLARPSLGGTLGLRFIVELRETEIVGVDHAVFQAGTPSKNSNTSLRQNPPNAFGYRLLQR